MVTVGVLALQGDFDKHLETLTRLSTAAIEVRTPKDLEAAGALIIPGGESTTLRKMMKSCGLWNVLLDRRTDDFPVFGTCAGLILLGERISDGKPDEDALQYLNVTTRRNAYGRQKNSFIAPLSIQLNGRRESLDAVFIRAAKIESVSSPVQVLAELGGSPVLVRQGNALGAAFHPELTDSTAIHTLFLKLARERWS
ncbi:MAG: pyridoxal 5'-phosphate synthase glutaminase subunit PdxT [bacterium]